MKLKKKNTKRKNTKRKYNKKGGAAAVDTANMSGIDPISQSIIDLKDN